MKSTVKIGILLALALFIVSVAAVHSAGATYVGLAKCKMCHKPEATQWEGTKHAKAWTLLKPEEQAKADCVACHSTGAAANQGVQCEACHGAGSEYSKPAIMSKAKYTADAKAAGAAAAAAGLIAKPVEAQCVVCHNKKSPTFKGFVFADAITKVKHK